MRMIDLTGKQFGRLTVLCRSESVGNRKQIKWDCICECGNTKTIEGGSLKDGSSKSCGCLVYENKPNQTHGLSKSRIYRIYRHMINRCYNTNVESYPLYGGRGISVCGEWMTFEPFYQWSIKNGYADDLSIERKDNDAGYSPDNCRWATVVDQARNKRTTVASVEIADEVRALRKSGVRNRDVAEMFGMARTTVSDITYFRTWSDDPAKRTKGKADAETLTVNGQTKTAVEWAKEPGIDVNYSTIMRRKKHGMSDFDALFSPKKTHTKNSAKAERKTAGAC